MTTPTLFPAKYAGSFTDFLEAKVDRSGAMRFEPFTVTIPASTVSGTNIGLVPFRKGARFVPHSSGIIVTDLDTGTAVTLTAGYVYDDNVTFTNAPAAFAASSTIAQTGGALSLNALATSHTFVAEADGWVTITTGGGSTTTAGTVTGSVVLSYDI